MQSIHEYHNYARFVAQSVDQMNWTPAVWIDLYKRYEPITSAPVFTSAEAAIHWALEAWA